MIAQIVVFSRKTDAQRKKNFAFHSAKVLRMETLDKNNRNRILFL